MTNPLMVLSTNKENRRLDVDSEASRVADLQEGSESQETSKASARDGHGLGSTGGGGRGDSGGSSRAGGGRGRNDHGDAAGGLVSQGGVLVRGNNRGDAGRLRSAGVADNGAGGGDRLGDGAGAVGDGQGGGLSDSVGGAAVGDLGRAGAVGDVGLDDLSDNGDVALGVVSRGASGGSENDGSGELHLDGIKVD